MLDYPHQKALKTNIKIAISILRREDSLVTEVGTSLLKAMAHFGGA